MTQEELAERAGLTSGAVSALERGHRRRPYPHTLRALAAALSLPESQQEAFVALTRQGSLGRFRAELTEPEHAAVPARPLVPLSSFVGREHELTQLCELLRTSRLVTLVGIGGVGKTRLAVELARRLTDAYLDGTSVVELAPLTTQRMLFQAVAIALGVHEKQDEPLLQTLVQRLERRSVLLVLDNCEHLLEECAKLVDRLLRTCTRLNIVATSRQALRVAGEIAWPVPTLQYPDTTRPTTTAELLEFAATRLFVERAAAIQPDFALTDEHSPAVANICRRLDGLPLAIELAAARVNALGVQQIAQRLDNRFRLLVHGSRTAPRRQQTLRATIDWSYELLSEPERLLFDRLAVFADGWTLEAAEIVASGDEVNDVDVLENLSQLVEKSLVVAELGEGGAMRYRLLETLREYGSERLAARNETQRVARRHAEFYLALAERADKELRGPGMRAWLDRLEIEQNNLRAALSWAASQADDLTGLHLAGALGLFWMSRRYWSEGLRWLELFLARPECAPRTAARAHALHYAGLLAGHRNDFSTAQARVEEGAAIARELNVSGPIGGLGWFRGFRGDHIAAGELQREDVRLAQRSGDQFSEALALQMLGVVLLQHDRAQSLIALTESARLFHQVGNPWGIGMALNGLGDLARWEGDYARARELYEQSLACFRDAQSDTERSVLQNLGYVAHRQGDHRPAAEFILDGLAQFVREGDHRGTAECFVALGGVAGALGRPEQAALLFGAADQLLKTIDADLTPLCRTEYELDLNATRAQLHNESFARFWAEGETLPLERVLVEASTVATIDTVPARAESEASRTVAGSLTEREREVLDLLGRGLSNQLIAHTLIIGVRTAETHVEHVLRKLGLQNRAQAMLWAREHHPSGQSSG